MAHRRRDPGYDVPSLVTPLKKPKIFLKIGFIYFLIKLKNLIGTPKKNCKNRIFIFEDLFLRVLA